MANTGCNHAKQSVAATGYDSVEKEWIRWMKEGKEKRSGRPLARPSVSKEFVSVN